MATAGVVAAERNSRAADSIVTQCAPPPDYGILRIGILLAISRPLAEGRLFRRPGRVLSWKELSVVLAVHVYHVHEFRADQGAAC